MCAMICAERIHCSAFLFIEIRLYSVYYNYDRESEQHMPSVQKTCTLDDGQLDRNM
jgi:hypothetical protein